MKKTLLFFFLLSFVFIKTNGQQKDYSGKWQGIVNVEGKDYSQLYTFEKNDKGIYSGTLTDLKASVSSDQLPNGTQEMALSLPFDSIVIKKDSLFAFINIGGAAPCVYKGYMQSDSVMRGTWQTPAKSYPLDTKLVTGKTTVFTPVTTHDTKNIFAYSNQRISGILPENEFTKN